MNTAEILACISRLHVLVVGDICLDRWCTYDPHASDVSRETGIPRIGVVRTEVTPGAGGTVANNLVALGVQKVSLLGVMGEDGFGYELGKVLQSREIDAGLMVSSPQTGTFTYTKLINGDTGAEDKPRVDFISTRRLPDAVEAEVLRRLQEHASRFDLIIVADQAETVAGGVITAHVQQVLAEIGRSGQIVWVDSRMRLEMFRNVILKSNMAEAEAAAERATGSSALGRLRVLCNSPLQIVTCGAEGALLIQEHGDTHVATRSVGAPVDICGAGDSFTAGAAAALAAGAAPADAAQFGNMVASVTIMKKGTGTASPEEVLAVDRDWNR